MKLRPGILLSVMLVTILAAACSASTDGGGAGYPGSGGPALLYFYRDG